MVNRAAVGLLLGAVIVVVFIAGTVVVLIGSGPTETGTPTPTDIRATPPPGTGTETSSPTPVAATVAVPTTRSPTRTATRVTATRTTIAIDEFQPREIEASIRRRINDRRRERGLETLRSDTKPVERLNPMARNHSREMARVDRVTHTVDGVTVGERYRQHGLYGTCKWKAAGESYIVRPDDPRPAQLEVVGRTVAGRPYQVDGETRFNANETAVARALVADWFDGYPDERKFFLEKASQVGVGVHVTLSGDVYATVALC